jgi:hypothetical protein
MSSSIGLQSLAERFSTVGIVLRIPHSNSLLTKSAEILSVAHSDWRRPIIPFLGPVSADQVWIAEIVDLEYGEPASRIAHSYDAGGDENMKPTSVIYNMYHLMGEVGKHVTKVCTCTYLRLPWGHSPYSYAMLLTDSLQSVPIPTWWLSLTLEKARLPPGLL